MTANEARALRDKSLEDIYKRNIKSVDSAIREAAKNGHSEVQTVVFYPLKDRIVKDYEDKGFTSGEVSIFYDRGTIKLLW